MPSIKGNIMYFILPDPIRPQGYQDNLRHNKEKNDPEAPPPKKPGDAYIAGGALVGLILGGIVSFMFTRTLVGDAKVILTTAAGIIVGGIIGVFIGDLLKHRKFPKS